MRKILIADDESALRYLISETLSIEDDYEIQTAQDGAEALKMVGEFEPELLLLDVMMPKMTGYEVAEALSKKEKRLKIIMLTAKAQQADIEKGMSLGVSHYLTKPFSPMDLLDLVEQVLAET